MSYSENITGTLCAQMNQHQPLVLSIGREVQEEQIPRVYENHGIDSRYTGPYKFSPTISARCGTGGNNVPLISEDTTVYCISGNTIEREPENGGNGLGFNENVSFTLTTSDRPAIFSRQRTDVFSENDVVSTEGARQHKAATDLVMQPYQETVGTLVKSDHKGISNQYVSDDKCIVDGINLIRRLTPLECERLKVSRMGGQTSHPHPIRPATRRWGTVWRFHALSSLCRGWCWYLNMKMRSGEGGDTGSASENCSDALHENI